MYTREFFNLKKNKREGLRKQKASKSTAEGCKRALLVSKQVECTAIMLAKAARRLAVTAGGFTAVAAACNHHRVSFL